MLEMSFCSSMICGRPEAKDIVMPNWKETEEKAHEGQSSPIDSPQTYADSSEFIVIISNNKDQRTDKPGLDVPLALIF